MKKLGFAFAALSVIAIAAPSVASAETTTIIKRGGHHHHWDRARAEYRGHDMRAFHHPHTGRTVIIKKRREY